uniref:Transmembrane channel-like protein 6 isoform X2 n=1 Tax=Camelus bactrianus TaxID=9837 RepID=A0A9W3FZA9_CAMBA|nr:transmembrane channel-like protein 6 isoform X2 [Camelus bactrianus]
MAQPPVFVLSVPETPDDPEGQEPSPYDESEVHDSFYQLIQEQSRWAAEEGLELQQREPGPGALGALGDDHQALLGPEGVPVHSMATLRILASMPSRTIGEWDPLPSDPGWGGGFRLGAHSAPTHPGCCLQAQHGPRQSRRVLKTTQSRHGDKNRLLETH